MADRPVLRESKGWPSCIETLLTASTGVGEHGMNLFWTAEDGIGRAALETLGATNAEIFVHESDHRCLLFHIRQIDADPNFVPKASASALPPGGHSVTDALPSATAAAAGPQPG
jgi:hypothetical protein